MIWNRIFCRDETPIPPVEILQALHEAGFAVRGDFRGDDLGWTSGALRWQTEGSDEAETGIVLECFLTEADDLRDELNTWAAWLESEGSGSEERTPWMEHLIQVRQLITLRPLDGLEFDAAWQPVAAHLRRWIAQRRDGMIQIDGQGFFSAEEQLLVRE